MKHTARGLDKYQDKGLSKGSEGSKGREEAWVRDGGFVMMNLQDGK